MRNPAELASALRVSLSAEVNSSTWPPLTMPKPALPSRISTVAATPARLRQIALEQRDQARRRIALETRPVDRFGSRTRAQAEPLAQQHDRANGGRFQVSLGPRRSQRSSEASCTIHCTSSSNVVPAKALRALAQMTSRSCRVGVDLRQKRPCSLDAVVEAEIRNSSRPGSQAPHAPPALTFGLPGKQKVNPVRTGRVLIRPVRYLPDISQFYPFHGPDSPGPFPAVCPERCLRPVRVAASAIWSCRKSANSMPCALSAFG